MSSFWKRQATNNFNWNEQETLRTYDKFFNEKGELVHDDGEPGNLYVVDSEYYNKGVILYKQNCDELAAYLRLKCLRAYRTEEEAAKSWAPKGHKLTRQEGDNMERAAVIVEASTTGHPNIKKIYVVGTTVKGEESDEPGVIQEVDPLESETIINDKELLDQKSCVEVPKFYPTYNIYNTPPYVHYFVKWGWMDEPGEMGVGKDCSKHWKIIAVIHTHPKGNERFSASQGDFLKGRQVGGDIGFAKYEKCDVYLVPTTHEKLSYMYRINTEDFQNKSFPSTYDYEDYGESKRDTIYFNK